MYPNTRNSIDAVTITKPMPEPMRASPVPHRPKKRASPFCVLSAGTFVEGSGGLVGLDCIVQCSRISKLLLDQDRFRCPLSISGIFRPRQRSRAVGIALGRRLKLHVTAVLVEARFPCECHGNLVSQSEDADLKPDAREVDGVVLDDRAGIGPVALPKIYCSMQQLYRDVET